MASTVTHLVIGERVFPHLLRPGPVRCCAADYAPFLLGCVLVDVHWCGPIDRRTTHFAARFDQEGPDALDRSCTNFINRLDGLLVRPWDALTSAERAFIAGYLCHLAADEEWKRFDLHLIRTLGLRWWRDLPVPVTVTLTAFDALSSAHYRDPEAVSRALSDVTVPAILAHVPHSAFQAAWRVMQPRAIRGTTVESYYETLGRLGKAPAKIDAARRTHELHWQGALALIHDAFGGVEARIQAMVARSLEAAPLLTAWAAARQGRG